MSAHPLTVPTLLLVAALPPGPDAAVGHDPVTLRRGSFTMAALDQGMGQLEQDFTQRQGTVVTFDHPLLMTRTEITQADFKATLGRNPSKSVDAADAPLGPA